MRGVAGEQHAPPAPGVRHTGVKSVDDTPLDFDTGEVDIWREELFDARVTGELIGILTRQLHEFEADTRTDRRQTNRRPAWVAKERDLVDVVIFDQCVDDQPAFGVSRSDERVPIASRVALAPPSQPTTYLARSFRCPRGVSIRTSTPSRSCANAVTVWPNSARADANRPKPASSTLSKCG